MVNNVLRWSRIHHSSVPDPSSSCQWLGTPSSEPQHYKLVGARYRSKSRNPLVRVFTQEWHGIDEATVHRWWWASYLFCSWVGTSHCLCSQGYVLSSGTPLFDSHPIKSFAVFSSPDCVIFWPSMITINSSSTPPPAINIFHKHISKSRECPPIYRIKSKTCQRRIC